MVLEDTSSLLPLQSLLETYVRRALLLLEADSGAVRLTDEPDNLIVVTTSQGLPSETKSPIHDNNCLKISQRVITTGEPLVLNDVLSFLHIESPKGSVIRSAVSCICVPLIIHDGTIGSFEVYRETNPQPFGPTHINTMSSLAREAALAVSHLRLVRSQLKQQRRADVLLELALAASSSIELTEVLERVVEKAAILMGADRCSIWFLDENQENLTSAAIYGIDPDFSARWKRNSLVISEEPLSQEAITSGKPVIILDAQTDPRTDKNAVTFFGDKSILVVPLVFKGATLGSLFLNYIYEKHEFSADEIELIQALASQASIAIQNAKLYAESTKKSESLRRSFSQVGAALASGYDLQRILQLIVDAASEFVNADLAGIQVLDGDAATEVVFLAARGFPWEWVESIRIPADEGVIGRILHDRSPYSIEGISDIESLFKIPNLKDKGIKGYLGIPLLLKGTPIGVLSVFASRPGGFSQEEVDLLSSFANQAAIAFENSELFEGAKRRAEELGMLHDVSVAINSTLELQKILEVVAGAAVTMTGTDVASIFIVDGNTGKAVEAVTVPHDLGYRTPIRKEGLTSLIMQTGEKVIISDTTSDPRVNPAVIKKGIRSVLGMPLKVDGTPVGVLYLNALKPHHFTEHTDALLSVLANQTAAALKNAKLFADVVQEKEKLAAIYSNSTDGILMVDANCKIVGFNPALEKLTGITSQEALGQPCSLIYAGCDEDCSKSMACSMGKVLQSGASIPYTEDHLVTKDGVGVDVAASYSIIPVPNGGVLFGVSIMRDITELKRVERLKSDFVSTVSHELRTPLSLIKGYTSTLLREDMHFDQDSERRFLRNIDEAADRLTRLMNDLLSVTRIETGRLSLKKSVVDLKGIVEKVIEQTEIDEDKYNIQLELFSQPQMVLADEQRIQQILANLVDNAVKFSPEGGTVKVSTWTTGGEDANCPGIQTVQCVSVRDQGVGMTEEQVRHAFEKFYRGEGGLAQSTTGMGLGLFLAKGLVEAQGGRIWIESRVSKGTIISFCLPAA